MESLLTSDTRRVLLREGFKQSMRTKYGGKVRYTEGFDLTDLTEGKYSIWKGVELVHCMEDYNNVELRDSWLDQYLLELRKTGFIIQRLPSSLHITDSGPVKVTNITELEVGQVVGIEGGSWTGYYPTFKKYHIDTDEVEVLLNGSSYFLPSNKIRSVLPK